MVNRALQRFWSDQQGATMVEMTLVITLLLTLVLGFVDLGHAFYQWNAAAKSVQVGARMAAVSDAVASAVILRTAGTGNSALIGEQMPANSYWFRCQGGACTGSHEVAFDAGAFNRIYFGDIETCSRSPDGRSGMCDIFPGLNAENVVITYRATGLGFWTRPGGAVPTISISIEGQEFEFFFLGALLGFGQNGMITMPDMQSTITGEDLSTSF